MLSVCVSISGYNLEVKRTYLSVALIDWCPIYVDKIGIMQ